MRVSTLLVPFLIFASSFGIMTGCGGHHSSNDCTETLTENDEDNSVYNGSYTLTFTPDDGDALNTITAKVLVYNGGSGHGNIQGNVVDAGAASGVTDLDLASVVAKGHCDGGKTYVRLKFRRSVSPDPEQINATSDTLTGLVGVSVPAKLTTGSVSSGEVSGTLAISSSGGTL